MSNYPSKSTSNDDSKDWKKVLINIIVSIFTLGFYHVEKNRKSKSEKVGD